MGLPLCEEVGVDCIVADMTSQNGSVSLGDARRDQDRRSPGEQEGVEHPLVNHYPQNYLPPQIGYL